VAADVILVAGLGFGDEGKGSIVDYLAREKYTDLVVRYNGGAQAAHHVVTKNGVHHTFAQFGSGTFAAADTFLSKYMMVNPETLLAEAAGLEKVGVKKPLNLMWIDNCALVTTRFHRAANRLHERSRLSKHGSCGMGIGETASDAIAFPEEVLRAEDLTYERRSILQEKLVMLQKRKQKELEPLRESTSYAKSDWNIIDNDHSVRSEIAVIEGLRSIKEQQPRFVSEGFLDERLETSARIIFEGAQGVLLDENYGFHPHTTWSTCTFANALALLRNYKDPIKKLGVIRAYGTRHGQGPFPTENDDFHALSAHDHNNSDGSMQGSFRSGYFDLVLAKYALDVIGGVDGLAMTCLDRLPLYAGPLPVAVAYDSRDFEDRRYFETDNKDRLRVSARVDLAYQEGLTRAMGRLYAESEYVTLSKGQYGPLRYALGLADRLGTRLHLISEGPTAGHKMRIDNRG
jgi:adenylosuccinate synthase